MSQDDPDTQRMIELCHQIGALVEGFDEVQALAALTGVMAQLVTTFRRQDRPNIMADITNQMRVMVEAAEKIGR